MNYFKHPEAIVESLKIGQKTRVWAFAHILPGAVIGEDCNICDHTFIENDVILGDRVTIKCGVQVWDGITIEDDVFIGPNATFTNDRFPRSKQYLGQPLRTIIRKGASIGANATILPGITIGREAMVGAGSVVTRDVPPYAIVVGNPARIHGYVQKESPEKTSVQYQPSLAPAEIETGIGGVKVYELPLVKDLRGDLSFAQYPDHLPFVPKRYFLVFDVPSKEVRGAHAHREQHQFLVCIKGTCSVMVDNGEDRMEIELDRPNRGIYIPPMVWGVEYKYSKDAILLVLASDVYRSEDYIRDYDDYCEVLK